MGCIPLSRASMNIKKILWYLNSNNVATLTTPEIFAFNLYTDKMDLVWSDGADSYVVERATNSGFTTGLTTIYTGALATFQDTGLASGTTYYYRVQATLNSVVSDYGTDIAATISFTPSAWYEFGGVEYNTNNQYGVMNNNIFTSVKSIVNTSGPLATFAGAANSVLNFNKSHYAYPYILTQASSYADLASNISLTGDFTIVSCIIFQATPVNSKILNDSTVANNYIRINSLSQIIFAVSGVNTTITLTTAMVLNRLYNLVFQRNSGIIRVSIDGGSTWDTAGVANNNTVTINRLFPDIVQNFTRLVIYNNTLSTSQISEISNFLNKSDYTPSIASNPTSITLPTGINWNAFSGGYLVNTSLDDAATGSWARERVLVKGSFAFILASYKNEAPTYMEDVLFIWDMQNNLISDPILFPIIAGTNTDVHHNGEIFDFDGKIIQSEQIHYGTLASADNRMFFRKFGNNYSFDLNYSTAPSAKQVTRFGHYGNYHQFNKLGDSLFMYAQEQNPSGYAPYVNVFKNTDNLNFWEKNRITDAGASNWFYFYVPNNGTNSTTYLFLNYLDIAATPDEYDYCFLLKTTDGYTFTNLAGTFSQDIRNNNPITLANLISNCIFTTAAATKNAYVTSAITLPNGDCVGIASNGSDTGFDYFRISGTGVTKKAINFGGRGVIYNWTDALADQSLLTWYVSNTEIHIAVYELNGGNWNLAHYKTTDDGDIWSFVEIMNTDTTKKHQRMTINKANPFDSYAVMAATRKQSATEGSLFIKKLT